MKPFRFTLQAVRTVRERQEQTALEQLAAALHEHQTAARQVHQAEVALRAAGEDLHTRLRLGCPAAQARQLRSLCTAVEDRLQQARLSLRRAEALVQQAFETLLTARRQREVVDALRDHQKRRYDRDVARVEHKLLDEMGARRVTHEGQPEDNPS